MNRIRIGLSLTVIAGALYAAVGLFDSLGHFALGLCVAAAAVIGYGCLDYLDSHRDERIAQTREQVWARRDAETRTTPGVYVAERDEVA